LCDKQAQRVVLQEKVWVLGTRTPARVGKVRLAILHPIEAGSSQLR